MPDYSAARTVAPIIREHFARYIAGLTSGSPGSPGNPGSNVADVPDVDAIETIVDVAFWTSLRREEGYAPKISLALVPPDGASQPLRFERPLTLTTTALARVAPAVERPGIHLGVWRAGGDGDLLVWGALQYPLVGIVDRGDVVAAAAQLLGDRRGVHLVEEELQPSSERSRSRVCSSWSASSSTIAINLSVSCGYSA